MTGAVNFRTTQVGQFTVRELPMRLHLRVIKDHPEGGVERAAGYLGHAVSNGSAEPLGLEAVLDMPPALFNQLMDAYMEVTRRYDEPPRPSTPTASDTASTEGSAGGNA
jgi:hypothetical protein